MKTCFKCKQEKPLFDFYKHKGMADGHLNKCKECTKKDVHEHAHGKGREYRLAYDTTRSKLEHRKKLNNRTSKEYYEKNPSRTKANSKLNNAVKSGKVYKWPVCAMPDCTQTQVVGHHPDYDRPLDVVWLCQSHHKQAHAFKKD